MIREWKNEKEKKTKKKQSTEPINWPEKNKGLSVKALDFILPCDDRTSIPRQAAGDSQNPDLGC